MCVCVCDNHRVSRRRVFFARLLGYSARIWHGVFYFYPSETRDSNAQQYMRIRTVTTARGGNHRERRIEFFTRSGWLSRRHVSLLV